MSAPEPGPERDKSTSEILGQALGGAARRAGLDPAESSSTHKVVWSAMGGWRGILESVLPSLAFVIIFTIRPEPLILSLWDLGRSRGGLHDHPARSEVTTLGSPRRSRRRGCGCGAGAVDRTRR